jgi:hypothetical protein
MKMQPKLPARADLIAAGIIRYHKFKILSPREMCQALEILAEDLARIEDQQEALKIRTRVEGYALQIPQVDAVVHVARKTNADASESDYLPVHEETSRCEKMEQNIELSRDDTSCTRTKKDDIEGVVRVAQRYDIEEEESTTVHPEAALGARGQENSPTSEANRMYIPGAESRPVHQNSLSATKIQQEPGPAQDGGLCRRLPTADSQCAYVTQVERADPTGSWTWRKWTYNRVPPVIEAAVYDKFKQGWSKSKLAREFRLNRRTIIRICRDGGEGPVHQSGTRSGP